MSTTTETTLDRLEAAFASLAEQGWFVDIGSWWCISDAVDAVPAGLAYALVHQQDLECLEEHGRIYVAFGATDELGGSLDDAALADVGRQLHCSLIGHGLPAHWTGRPEHRIRVGGSDDT